MISLYGWTAIFGVLFLGLLFVLTYIATQRTEGLRDFIVAPTSYGPIWVGLAVGATACSAAATLGNPGLVYSYGWSGMWYGYGYGLMVIAWAVSAYQLNRFSRDLGANSLPDFFGKRFNSPFLRAFSAVVTLFLAFYIAGQFAGASLAITELTPLTYTTGILIGATIIVAYVLIGGAHAEILNSAVQGAFMLILGVITIVAGISAVGGIGAMNTAVAAQDPNLGASSIFGSPHFSAFNGPAIFLSLGLFALTPQLSRLWMALDEEKNVKWALLVSLIFMTVMYGLMLVGGLAGRAVAPNLETPDLATLVLVSEVVPDIVYAFVGVAIFAAIMSTTAGLFLTSAIAVSNDLYKDTLVPLFGWDIDAETLDRQTTLATRVMILVMAVVALIIALNPPDFLTGLMWIGIGAFAAAFAPILLWGSIWDGVTPVAAKVSAVVGFLIHVVGYFVLGQSLGMTLWTIPWRGSGLGIIVGFVLCPLLSLASTQTLDERFLNNIFYREYSEVNRTATERSKSDEVSDD
jgi:Na+/proline symporter